MKASFTDLKIKGICAAVPKQVLTMASFSKYFEEKEVNRIILGTGIESVRLADGRTNASDLCEFAAFTLMEQLDIPSHSIDGIVFVSQTPDLRMPATSCILQNRLNLRKDVVAFDINYGCSGYIYGLYQAAMLIKSGGCRRVLVCAGDTITKYLAPQDFKVRFVFGDAGSATIVEEGTSHWSFDIHTDGSGYKSLLIPKSEQGLDSDLYMDGGAIMEFVLREVKPSFENLLSTHGCKKDTLSLVILHQANQFILNYLRKKLGLPPAICPIAIKHYGNTGPASIPLTLCDQSITLPTHLEQSVLLGFGVGLSWGGCALDLSETYFSEVIEH